MAFANTPSCKKQTYLFISLSLKLLSILTVPSPPVVLFVFNINIIV